MTVVGDRPGALGDLGDRQSLGLAEVARQSDSATAFGHPVRWSGDGFGRHRSHRTQRAWSSCRTSLGGRPVARDALFTAPCPDALSARGIRAAAAPPRLSATGGDAVGARYFFPARKLPRNWSALGWSPASAGHASGRGGGVIRLPRNSGDRQEPHAIRAWQDLAPRRRPDSDEVTCVYRVPASVDLDVGRTA